MLRIDLGGVGVCRVADVRHVSGSQAIASSEVTMYCESAALAPAPQTTAPQPDAATASPAIATADLDRLAGRLAGVIAGRTPTTASSPQSIADRLLAATTTAPTAPADATELGRSLGRAWASDIAGLGELDDVAALADGGDWTGLASTATARWSRSSPSAGCSIRPCRRRASSTVTTSWPGWWPEPPRCTPR